jgi:hypothetical protein
MSPGEFIPSGEEASGESTHDNSVAAVQLFVEHDVTNDVDILLPSNIVVRPESCLGSITVVKDANGAGSLDFDFEGDLGNFNLENDESIIFEDLEADEYFINEIGADGWELDEVDCGDAVISDSDVDDGDIRVSLSQGENVTCVFTNSKVALATTVATTVATTITATATPVPQQPIIVEQRVIVEAPTAPVTNAVVSPPSTGDAGLVVDKFPTAFAVGDDGDGGCYPIVYQCWFRWFCRWYCS